MAGQTLSTFDALFKTFYGPKMVKLLNEKTRTLDLFTKEDVTTLTVSGRNFIYPIHLGRNPAVGAISDGNLLPVAQNQVTVDVTIPYFYNYLRIQITGPTLKQSVTNKGAFIKVVELEMQKGVDDLARDRNRQLWGFGVGIIAYVNGAQANTATINFRSPGGVAFPGGVSTGAARLALINQYVHFIDGSVTLTSAADSNIKSTAALQVSSISASGNSITLSAAPGYAPADGDYIVNAPAQSATQSSVNKEVMGLLGIVDDGTYLNSFFSVNRTTYPKWKAAVIVVNGNLSLDIIQRAFDLTDERGGDVKNIKMLSHHSVRREYLNLLLSPKKVYRRTGT